MFSGLATGQMPVLITGKGNFIHPAGAFCGFGFAKQQPEGCCAKRLATARSFFAKTPNNRTNVRLLQHTNIDGTICSFVPDQRLVVLTHDHHTIMQ